MGIARRQLTAEFWRFRVRMVAPDQPLESLLKRQEHPGYYRAARAACIVSCNNLPPWVTVLEIGALYSVSSVKTLEEAKVAPGCLYMGMPVQEVCVCHQLWSLLADDYPSLERCSSASLRRSRRKVTGQRWTSWRSGTRRDGCPLHTSGRREHLWRERGERVHAAIQYDETWTYPRSVHALSIRSASRCLVVRVACDRYQCAWRPWPRSRRSKADLPSPDHSLGTSLAPASWSPRAGHEVAL